MSMNQWLQTKPYQCPHCSAVYLHDQAYRHAAYECREREDRQTIMTRPRRDLIHAAGPERGKGRWPPSAPAPSNIGHEKSSTYEALAADSLLTSAKFDQENQNVMRLATTKLPA